jgi:hypothetical protein
MPARVQISVTGQVKGDLGSAEFCQELNASLAKLNAEVDDTAATEHATASPTCYNRSEVTFMMDYAAAIVKRSYRVPGLVLQHLTWWNDITEQDSASAHVSKVLERLPGGGFVFAPVHHIQQDVSGEKTLALYRTTLGEGRYRTG